MGIGNLSNKVSSSDIEAVKTKNNPPEYEPGFEPSGDDVNFDDFFDDLDDFGSFGSDTNGSIGGGSGGLDGGLGGSGFGGFGGQGLGGLGGSGFGGQQGNVSNVQESTFDKAVDVVIDKSGEGLKVLLDVTLKIIKSFKLRTVDDIAYYSRNLILIGVIAGGVGIGVGLIFSVFGIRMLGLKGLLGLVGFTGLNILGIGLIIMGSSAMIAIKFKDNMNLNSLPDIYSLDKNDKSMEYESTISSLNDIEDDLDSLFSDEDFGDLFNDGFGSNKDTFNVDFDNLDNGIDFDNKKEDKDKVTSINYIEVLESVKENSYINRQILFNTFEKFLPTNTPGFADKKEIKKNSDDFLTLETICLKALANVAKCEFTELKSSLESAYETYFSYELRLKRVRGLNKLDEIAREMEAYFRESSTDTSVNANVDIEGDFYKVTITKGVTAIVTFGDVFKLDYVRNYYLDTENVLPFIVGISELGEVILDDAKLHDTMLIAGKPRSGKSWYVLSILMSLMMFNTPEEVQFILVDPKESNLFKTLSLMPHVAGLHNDSNILDVMRDLIENEAPRRKKLLADNRCDDIWALWEKGIKIPVLYLVIDEVITVKNNLGNLDKEFDSLMQTIITQFPSLGIRLIFVPHRAMGVVNKTNRTMISFTAAVRSNTDDIKDTLGIQKWTRALVNKGDVAVKSSNMNNAMYVRGAALSISDNHNTELIENIAKAFYKMGVDLPDMSSLTVAYNRNEDEIRDILSSSGRRVQYNALNIFNDVEDIE